jgi:integral membrane sensor domain MASE1
MRKIAFHPSLKLLRVLDTAIGTLLCLSGAALLAAMFSSSSLKLAVPLLCLTVVLAVAAKFGPLPGVIGTVLTALLLAAFFYKPTGLYVANPTARANLGWLLLGGISLSFLFAPDPRAKLEDHGRRRSSDDDR